MTSAFSDYLFLIQFGPAVLKSVSILAIDLADPEMKVLFASELTEAMFCYERGELRGKSLDILLRSQDVLAHHQHYAEYQKAPITRSMNAGVWVDGLKKDGTTIKLQVSITVEPVGRMDCAIALIADVTNAFNRLHPEPFHH